MTRLEPLFVWLGGAAFAASLGFTGYRYAITWGRPRAFDPAEAAAALAIDGLLLSAFALHHSLFARERVKAAVGRLAPGRVLRSTYVWTASLLLLLAVGLWQPVGGDLYRLSGWRALPFAAAQVAGVWLIVAAARTIDPLELAGVRPARVVGGLHTAGPYRLVRHPLYLGWMLAVFGAAHMTGDRLAFAVLTSAYVVVAVPWEERSLAGVFGPQYTRYQQLVRWRVIPFVY